jgi:hypothetical protein
MKYLLLIIILWLSTSCAHLKKKDIQPPSVSTAQVVESLEGTKSELAKAGESNTKVAVNIDKALSLAEKLEKLLEEIESEQSGKTIVKKER